MNARIIIDVSGHKIIIDNGLRSYIYFSNPVVLFFRLRSIKKFYCLNIYNYDSVIDSFSKVYDNVVVW